MKSIAILVLSLFFVATSFQKSKSNLDFEFADNFCSSIEKQVDVISKNYQLSSSDILPIVYPEISRFNAFSNAFETDILAHYYLENGTSGADFSIGFFQMKPSFIENLEKQLLVDSSLTEYQNKFAYPTKSVKEIRDLRLDRMMSQTWQIEYLCLFVKIMQDRHSKNEISISQIEFLSAAYNYGFNATDKEIVNWSKQKAFPHGKNSNKQNFVYSELALNYKLNKYGHE